MNAPTRLPFDILSYPSGLAMVCLIIILQKFIFLESHTRRQLRTTGCVMLLGTIIGMILELTLDPSISSKVQVPGILFFFISTYGPIVYLGYVGRKKRKWLAFFEIIPLIGYHDSIISVIEVLSSKFETADEKNACIILITSLIISAIVLLPWKKLRFMRILIMDIRNRSLTVGEEVIVWLAGIWLSVYNIMLVDLIAPNSSIMMVNYTRLINFFAAFVILVYVVNSNRKDYYHKKNMHLQKSLILTVAELIEDRDSSTGGHIQRTSHYVQIIARRLKSEGKFSDILTEKYINDMVIAAPLHDVGKIRIPDAILNKPGRLDDEEFAIMKSHSAAGGEIISHIESTAGDIDYLKMAREMAEYHHERMDGKGYPHGLKGDEIPLCAKILAVADVFDAVSSKRCYKDAMSLAQSFAIIEEESGSHFDPVVAKAFLNCREEIIAAFG